MDPEIESGYQEASDMLAEALKQMDGIIAGTLKREKSSSSHNNHNYHQNGTLEPPSPPITHSPKLEQSRAVRLLNDLRVTLEGTHADQGQIFRQLAPDTQNFLQEWLERCGPSHNTGLTNGYSPHHSFDNSSENKLCGGHAVTDCKMRRLETDRDDLQLQVSVLSDQIEAQVEKIHDLERALRAANNGNSIVNGDMHGIYNHMELMNRNHGNSNGAQDTHKLDLLAENSSLKLRLAAVDREKSDLELKLTYAQKRMDDLQSRINDQTIELSELRARVAINGTIPSSPEPSDMNRERTLERERTLDRLKRKHSEVDRLKKAVESLMITNSEKDIHIDDLKKQVRRYRQLEEVLIGTQGRLAVENALDEDHSDSSSTQNSHTSGGDREHAERLPLRPDLRNQLVGQPTATSTPVNNVFDSPKSPSLVTNGNHGNQLQTPPSTITKAMQQQGIGRSSSYEDVKPQHRSSPGNQGPAFGAQTETDEEALKDEMAQQYKQLQQRNTEQIHRKHKNKGIKRFFGKLRRSNSQDLDPDKVGDFKRSGLRATAGPRLGWSKDMKYSDLDMPFVRWDTDRIASWLHGMGLSMYVGECKRWVRNGDQLMKATAQELEKEMGVRNHFHRKKLQLALASVTTDKKSAMDDLDHNWVTRWMDDIGLPQYKDQFSDARIDGRMLHYLTVEDLMSLKVTNVLHHLSVKRAIQVLRLSNFNPACLTRRPLPDEPNPQNAAGEVMMWTNHRVMEWLRSIDLSEYAPNLRGSGVHGGLMVLEPRFGAEIFASLLSIPNSKTLLRRHLSTHYVALIGNEIQSKKRELEMQPGFMPLTPNQKVKLKKKLFSHKRTRSVDTADEDLVCPQGVTAGLSNRGVLSNGTTGHGSPSTIGKHDTGNDKQNMLAKDRFLDNVPTSDV